MAGRYQPSTDLLNRRRKLWAYLSENQYAIPRQTAILETLGYPSRNCLQKDLAFLRRNGYLAPLGNTRHLRLLVTYLERPA